MKMEELLLTGDLGWKRERWNGWKLHGLPPSYRQPGALLLALFVVACSAPPSCSEPTVIDLAVKAIKAELVNKRQPWLIIGLNIDETDVSLADVRTTYARGGTVCKANVRLALVPFGWKKSDVPPTPPLIREVMYIVEKTDAGQLYVTAEIF